MPVLMGLLAAAGVIIFLLWRMGVIFQQGKQVVETAQDIGAAVRRHGWRSKGLDRPIEGVDEPKLAATTIIVMIIRAGTELDAARREMLRAGLGSTLSCEVSEAEELISEAIFVSQELNDRGHWIADLTRRVLHACTPEEKRDVLVLLRRVLGHTPIRDEQALLIRRYEEVAGLR